MAASDAEVNRLDEILAIVKDTNTRIRILQQTPTAASKKPPPRCRKCDAELKWPTPYVKGSHTPPVNKDGSAHVCPGGNPQQ
jgi:hypothetical protein